jgi:hypothetical protein
MTLEEFGHLLHYSQLFEWKQHEEIIEEIFMKTFPGDPKSELLNTNSSMNKSANNIRWLLMTRAHFVQALLAASMNANPSFPPDAAMRHILENVLFPFWEMITSKYFIYNSPDDQVKQAVRFFMLISLCDSNLFYSILFCFILFALIRCWNIIIY